MEKSGNKKIKFKSDKFKKSRGGYSRLLDISCGKCSEHLFFYQKDGQGILKRMYLDRIFESEEYSGHEKSALKNIPQLICNNCNTVIGIPYVYEKENRLAYRLFVGGVVKKIVKSK